MKYIVTIDDQEYQVEIVDETHVLLNGQEYHIDFDAVDDQSVYSLLVEGKSYEAFLSQNEGLWEVLLRGDLYNARVEDEREKRLLATSGSGVAERGEYHLKAPMPGLIVAIPVKDGQQVEKGEVLIILESMKMQNELRSPTAGIVSRIRVKPGDSVEQKQTILSVT